MKLDLKKGLLGGIQIGDSIAKTLTYVQMHVQVFGRIEVIASSRIADLDKPLYIVLPEIGKICQKLKPLQALSLDLTATSRT